METGNLHLLVSVMKHENISKISYIHMAVELSVFGHNVSDSVVSQLFLSF